MKALIIFLSIATVLMLQMPVQAESIVTEELAAVGNKSTALLKNDGHEVKNGNEVESIVDDEDQAEDEEDEGC